MKGSSPYFDIHTHGSSSDADVISVRSMFAQDCSADAAPTSPFSIGIHPWHAASVSYEEVADRMRALLSRASCVAIGEIGLDRACGIDIKRQVRLFDQQRALGAEFGTPLIIHCVRAYADLAGIRKAHAEEHTWIVHGFNGNVQTASQLLRLGIHLSFGAALLQPSPALQQAFLATPEDRLFFETDESHMQVSHVYAAASAMRQIPVEHLRDIVSFNYQRCFGTIA